MGSANFVRCRRRSPWIISGSRRCTFNNSRSRSRSMSRHRPEYRMGMHVNEATGEYDQFDVFSMITAAMGRCLITERIANTNTTASMEADDEEVKGIDAEAETTISPVLGSHILPMFQRSWVGECCACRRKIITRTLDRQSKCPLCQHAVCQECDELDRSTLTDKDYDWLEMVEENYEAEEEAREERKCMLYSIAEEEEKAEQARLDEADMWDDYLEDLVEDGILVRKV